MVANIRLRVTAACVIIIISYFYFRYFPFLEYSFSHLVYFVLIMIALTVAFLSRRRDVTYGILFGLIFVLMALLILFALFTIGAN